jgi:Ubiquitin-protein ligase
MPFKITSCTHENYLIINFYKQLVQDVLLSPIMAYKERKRFWLPQPEMLLTQYSSLIPAHAYMRFSWHRVKISSILTVLTLSYNPGTGHVIPLICINFIPGIDANASLVQWFWDVMEEFTNQERSLFLRFVWGRTRLPRTIADFRGRDFVLQVSKMCRTCCLHLHCQSVFSGQFKNPF